jgi:hypothetical protein
MFISGEQIYQGVILLANKKQTSKKVATKASKILKDGRFSKDSKSVAGSALSQTKTTKRPK